MRLCRHLPWTVAACMLLLAWPARAEQSAGGRERISQLIQQLGAKEYFARQSAQDELAELGAEAFDALAEAQSSRDVEVAARAKFLLRSLRVDPVREGDPDKAKALMHGYADAKSEFRLQTILKLAALENPSPVELLCRIARFERSELLSRRAAVSVLALTPPKEEKRKQLAAAVATSLGPSRRAASGWLRRYAESLSNQSPAAVAKAWAEITGAEWNAWKRGSADTDRQIVAALLKYRVELLEQHPQGEEIIEVVGRLVELQPGDADSLVKLIDWVAKHKAWQALDGIEQRFHSIISAQPLVLYALASAREVQGNPELAKKTAQKALAVKPSDHRTHYSLAYKLRDRGRFAWAEAEFRHVISLPPQGNIYAIASAFPLSEMLHDQERELDAAKVLEATVAAMDQNAKNGQADNNLDRDPKEVRARMHYFFGMHEAGRDEKKQIEHFDQAIAADPKEADVLIALYRLPNQDDARRQKTSAAIKKAVEAFREQIKKNPNDSSGYNQFAWLVSNTEGDKQEALRFSKKSLELKPGTSAFLDTLGRCYYAVKDYKNALKHQRMAVELEPHSMQMRRQLELFEKAAKSRC